MDTLTIVSREHILSLYRNSGDCRCHQDRNFYIMASQRESEVRTSVVECKILENLTQSVDYDIVRRDNELYAMTDLPYCHVSTAF